MIVNQSVQFYTNRWLVDSPKAIIHVVHGMSEHAARYEEFAKSMNESGISVIASDLRGHGKTAGPISNIGFFAEKDGWQLVVDDVTSLTEAIKNESPDIPLYMLGHSMGSFVTRNIAFQNPNLVSGYILSGTSGHPGWKGVIGKPMARFLSILFGKKSRSKFLMNTSFSGFNSKIKNKRTDQDWISRDEKIVDAYIKDPFCMQTFTNQFFYDLANGLLTISKQSNIDRIKTSSPVLMISGNADPVGKYGKGPTEVFEKYKKAGASHIELKLFEGGRHEILNETNRGEVFQTIVDWVNSQRI